MIGTLLFGGFLMIFGKDNKDYSKPYYNNGTCVKYLSLVDGFHYTGKVQWVYVSPYYEISKYQETYATYTVETETVHTDEIKEQVQCP